MTGTNSASRDEDNILSIIQFVAPDRLPLQEVEGRKYHLLQPGIPAIGFQVSNIAKANIPQKPEQVTRV